MLSRVGRRLHWVGVVGVVFAISVGAALAHEPVTSSTKFAAPMSEPAPSSSGVSLVGALRLLPTGSRGVVGDLSALGNLVAVGSAGGINVDGCGRGVSLVDIANPAAPAFIAATPGYDSTRLEDVQLHAVGGRTVLFVGAQRCGLASGRRGLIMFDVTDPHAPVESGFFPVGARGVHELDVALTPSGRWVALLAVPNSERQGGVGDIWIVDVSSPAAPVLLGDYGVRGDPGLGPAFVKRAARGEYAASYGHSARFDGTRTRAYISYWDAGAIILDLTDPAHPVRIGATTYRATDEGNAHSVAEVDGGKIMIEADEDAWPISGAIDVLGGRRRTHRAVDHGFGWFAALVPRPRVVKTTYVGDACRGKVVPPLTSPSPDEWAVASLGGCTTLRKTRLVEQAGYRGLLVMPPGGSADTVAVWDIETEKGSSSAIGITRRAGLDVLGTPRLRGLKPGTAGRRIRVRPVFTGWGALRIFDISDPASPRQLSRVTTPASRNARQAALDVNAEFAWRSAHNPEVLGARLYASWYREGVRVIDIANPAAPVEVGHWSGAGRPADAPFVNVWSVIPHNGLLLVSDLDFGLYVLRDDGAPPPA